MKKSRMLNALLQGVMISFVIAITTSSMASASTLIMQPGPSDGIDANWYSYYNSPINFNYGNIYEFEIGTQAYSFAGQGLLKFNVPSEVTGATIQSATLELYAQNIYYYASGGIVYVNRATSIWGELNGTLFTPPTYDSLYQTSYIVPARQGTWVSVDITDMLDFWVSSPSQNYGMVLTSAADLAYYPSSDYPDPTLRPKLTIEYSTGNPVPEPATMALFGLGSVGMAFLKRRKLTVGV